MKTVFNSNSQLCHVWANQLQKTGKGSNLFFEDQILYSYGYHYQVATFQRLPNNDLICFVNDNGYSNSTAKHTNHALNAIPDNIKVFIVPFLRDAGKQYFNADRLPEILDKMLINCKNAIYDQLKAKTRFTYFYHASNIYSNIIEICTLFSLPIPQRPENLDKAKEKSDHLRATQKERENKKQIRELEKNKELLNKWLNHDFNGCFYNIPVHLRLSKDGQQIETTKGAKVSKNAALILLNKLKSFANVKGEKIDGFTVLENSSEFVKIGCHVIKWDIINEFAKKTFLIN